MDDTVSPCRWFPTFRDRIFFKHLHLWKWTTALFRKVVNQLPSDVGSYSKERIRVLIWWSGMFLEKLIVPWLVKDCHALQAFHPTLKLLWIVQFFPNFTQFFTSTTKVGFQIVSHFGWAAMLSMLHDYSKDRRTNCARMWDRSLWDMVSREVLRTLMVGFQRFGRTCCFCPGLLHAKYGGVRYILNAGTHLPDCTGSHRRGLMLGFIFCIATTYFTIARSTLDVN
jgi:hypothetical protein